jgi:hypothetical protein
MKKIVYVYQLVEYGTHIPRYVGQTSAVKKV